MPSHSSTRFRVAGRAAKPPDAENVRNDVPSDVPSDVAEPDEPGVVTSATDVEGVLRAETTRVFHDGLQIALPILLAVFFVFVGADLVLRLGTYPWVYQVHFVMIASAGAAYAALGRTRRPETLRTLALAVILMVIAGTGVQGILHGEFAINPVLLSVLTVGSAAIFPWGARIQALAGLATAISLTANLAFVPYNLPSAELLPHIMAVAVSLVGSIALARITERRFLRTVSLMAQRATAEAALQQLNESLEARVLERTAELAEASQEMEAFSYALSHDLRSPLRSIDGFAFATLEELGERASTHTTDSLNRIRRAADRMSRLIDGLLRLGRAGRQRLQRETVDLSGEAASIIAEMAEEEPSRRVEVQIAPGAIALVDRRLIRVVLVNLLGNAWKYTRAVESARIEFGYESLTDSVAYHVRDNGPGFEMERVDDLFVPFSRLHSDPEFEGSGVGLATVDRIVSRLGGRAWARGIPGQGATFYFTVDSGLAPAMPALGASKRSAGA